MIHRIVQFALRQKPIVLFLVALIAMGGAVAFHNMPVDAYPDLSPPMVESLRSGRATRRKRWSGW